MTAAPSRQKARAAPHMVSVRLTEREHGRLVLAVRAAGLTRSAYCRRALLDRSVTFRPIEPLLADAIALLAHCRTLRGDDAAELRRTVARVEQLVLQLSDLAGTSV